MLNFYSRDQFPREKNAKDAPENNDAREMFHTRCRRRWRRLRLHAFRCMPLIAGVSILISGFVDAGSPALLRIMHWPTMRSLQLHFWED